MNAWRVGVYGRFAAAAARHAVDEFRVIGSVWSPPIWMKGQERGFADDPQFQADWVDGRAVPRLDAAGNPVPKLPFLRETNVVGGSLVDTPENRAEFGRFVAGYARAFEDEWGVEIDAVSLGNEPRLSTFYGSTVYSPGVYAKTLVALREQLDAAGLGTQIFGPETVGTGSVDDPGTFWQTMKFVDAIRDTPGALDALDAWAVHGYDASGVGAGGSGEMWRQLIRGRGPADNLKPDGTPDWRGYVYTNADDTLYGPEEGLTRREGLAVDGLPVWMTEASGQADVWHSDDPADAGGALGLATTVHHALVDGNVSAYVYWLFGDDSPGLSPSQSVDGTDPRGPNFNALKHWFRHIRPGAVRVGLGGAEAATAGGLLASAFAHDGHGTLTLVLLNKAPEAQELELDLSGLADPPALTRFASDARVRFERGADLRPDAGGVLRLTLGPRSLTTLVSAGAVAGGR